MALQRPARLLRFDKMIENKGLTRIRVGSNCRKMRVFRDHESETGKVPLGSVSHGRSLSSSGETWMVRRSLLGQSNLPATKLPETARLNIEDSDNRTI